MILLSWEKCSILGIFADKLQWEKKTLFGFGNGTVFWTLNDKAKNHCMHSSG